MAKKGTSSPLVSVVMCTYNSDKYIAEAIASILNQTYENFEFIIWDDGSTDGTRAIVESFRDERIRYFFHENTGLGMALKLACEKAKGKYIARMDSDDVCLPERLAKEVEFLESHNDYVLVSSAVIKIDEGGKLLGRTFPVSKSDVLQKYLRYGNMICHPMVMMRRDAYNRIGGYVPLRRAQDEVTWSKLAKEGMFFNISTPLGKYRILSTSLDHAKNIYDGVLLAFRQKMIKDERISDADIELYNSIFLESKKSKKNTRISPHRVKLKFDEYLYNTLRLFIGELLSEAFVVGLKNYIYSLKLRR